MDNCLKILAIHMKLKCEIPVVLMGETGCGKTRLIDFYSRLLKPPEKKTRKNKILMKVHGGITVNDIEKKVLEAQNLARENSEHDLDTILFFDEANTTEAIHAIKEILCDDSLKGNVLNCKKYRLKVIAACNPYRKHKENIIEMLEKAGLGYYVKKTKDKLGGVPMRQLVYRVQALPYSMLPFVWDFGQLSSDVEKLYIRQIVRRILENCNESLIDIMTDVLSGAQNFMRKDQTECRFVSLRDVERSMKVMQWFLKVSDKLFPLMTEKSNLMKSEASSDENEHSLDSVIRALILSLGVCYYCSLNSSRREFIREISEILHDFLPESQENDVIEREIRLCQNVFLDGLELNTSDTNPIARNSALRENVWMMMICVELCIPLFVVGKPGSSKSLSKSKVEKSMKGQNSIYDLFKVMKDIKMTSYQCSPLSTPEGIVQTYQLCANMQNESTENFAAVMVLDEIGLAEDSPLMPLKALHALLDDGSTEDEIRPNKPSFIGISNWALDPAKMNRGVLMNCCVPNRSELRKTLEEICGRNKVTFNRISSLIDVLTKGYLEVSKEAEETREFFGLRDFYHLIKMVYYFSLKSKQKPTVQQFEHAIRRNLSGLMNLDPFEHFSSNINDEMFSKAIEEERNLNKPEVILRRALEGNELGAESRYVLLITENYIALNLVKSKLGLNYDIIFGSSFRKDQDYTQLCLNINRVKMCMEVGKSVILLNLDSIYESLYDALNQYYSLLGDQRFVDIGLGNHRIKAQVHKNFRLIVVAEQDDVKRFPTPLLNRLEKHCLTISTLLNENQMKFVRNLEEWVSSFAREITTFREKLKQEDIFIGYGKDTVATMLLQESNDYIDESETFEIIKKKLIRIATPDSLLKYKSRRKDDELVNLEAIYEEQGDIFRVLQTFRDKNFIQVTTHSRLLTGEEFQSLNFPNAEMHMLHNFNTEYEFDRMLKKLNHSSKILFLQSDTTNLHLLACARFKIEDKKYNLKQVIYIIRVTRAGQSFNGIHGGKWTCLHVDELRRPKFYASVEALKNNSVSSLFEKSINSNEALIDCKAIIDSCLIESVSLLRDRKLFDTKNSRNSERLKILWSALKNENCQRIFQKKVSCLLRDREQSVGDNSSSEWLRKYAATLRGVTDAGTFRKSWQIYIQDKITKSLAALIAFTDINFNLKGLEENPEKWLEILNDKRLGAFSYLSLTNEHNSQRIETSEVCFIPVSHVSQSLECSLKTRIPFSWVLFEKIEIIHDEMLAYDYDKGAIEERLKQEKIVELFTEKIPDWEKLYMEDAIRMLHKNSFQHEEECQVDSSFKSYLFLGHIFSVDYIESNSARA